MRAKADEGSQPELLSVTATDAALQLLPIVMPPAPISRLFGSK